MSLDFTLEKYRELCEAVTKLQYTVLTVGTYLVSQNLPQKYIILRHDVDRNPNRALQMARLEHEFNINTSYYFRFNKRTFQPNLVREIANMGHEIGYHYETLDKANGDYERAVQIFEFELEEIRKVIAVKTICMHGNPLTRWNNIDLWNKYDFKDLGIIGDAFLSFHEITYFSDTGRTWNNRFKIKDRFPHNISSDGRDKENATVKSTDDLIHLIKRESLQSIYIGVHPERWSGNLFGWMKSLAFDIGVNLGKQLIMLMNPRILSGG